MNSYSLFYYAEKAHAFFESWLNNHFDVLFIDAKMYLPFKFVISPFNGIFQSMKKPAHGTVSTVLNWQEILKCDAVALGASCYLVSS